MRDSGKRVVTENERPRSDTCSMAQFGVCLSSLATPPSRCRFVGAATSPVLSRFLYGENRRVVDLKNRRKRPSASRFGRFFTQKTQKSDFPEPPRHNSTCISPTSTTDTSNNMFALSASRITGSAVKLSVKSRAVRARRAASIRVRAEGEAEKVAVADEVKAADAAWEEKAAEPAAAPAAFSAAIDPADGSVAEAAPLGDDMSMLNDAMIASRSPARLRSSTAACAR